MKTQIMSAKERSRKNACCLYHHLSDLQLNDVLVSNRPDREGMELTTPVYNGFISFYDDIIELYIEEKETGRTVYYLHFETIDYDESLENIVTFFDTLLQKNPLQEESQVRKENLNLLICCTSGITSSMYAATMQEKFEEVHIHVDAKSYMELDERDNQYDLILLAPQIRYALKDLQQQYGDKVQMINTLDFATGRFNSLSDSLALLH